MAAVDGRRFGDGAVRRWRSLIAGGWLGIRTSSREIPVQAVLRPVVLRSTEGIKADGCDGRGDFRAAIFEGPVFAGDHGRNVARERSWPGGELGNAHTILCSALGGWVPRRRAT